MYLRCTRIQFNNLYVCKSFYVLFVKMKQMNKRVMRKMHPLLKIISKLKVEDRRVILHYLTHEGCEGIYECIGNALWNPTLRKTDQLFLQEKLTPQKFKLRNLMKETDPVKKKRALLQVGEGTTGLILNKVIPLLDDFLKQEEKKKKTQQE